MALAMIAGACPALAQEAPSDAAHPAEELAGQATPADSAASSAPAQFPLSEAPRIYYPADFTRTSPRTALDLVEEIPGFTMSGNNGGGNLPSGDAGRGFGEASGNLLINGDRISTKSSSVRDELARIPIANVVRVEVVDGATLQIPGLSGQVANVIVLSTGMSGQFVWRPQASTGPAPILWSDGDISLRGSTHGVDFTLAFEGNSFARGSEGPAIFTDALGVVDPRFNTQHALFQRPALRGTFAFEPAAGVQVNLNLSGGWQIFRSREHETRVAGNPLPAFDERFRSANNERFYELGGDVRFPLGPGTLKLIALESFEHGNFRTQSLLDLGNAPTTGSRFQRLSDTGERIGRAEYAWSMLGGDWQISGEAAFNRLDNVGSLFLFDDASESFVEIPFPAGTGGVREDRYESILSYGRPLTGNLTMQLAVGAEYSQISQTGVAANSRTFQRPKGSLSLAWAAAEGLNVSLRISRRVGQLQFTDFLASVNLSEDNQNGGNNELRPEQSWESELEVQRNFGEFGSLTLALFDHRIEDFLLIVPLNGGGESRGNIASATRQGLRANGRLQLTPLGFHGAVFDARVTAERSSLIDPVTLGRRRMDRLSPFEIRLDFRHDVPSTQWAWGAEFRHTEHAANYRVAEVINDYNVPTFGAIFLENKDVFGLTVRGRVANLFNGKNVLRRSVWTGPRNTAPFAFTEDRQLTIGTVFNLTVSGSF